MSEITIDSLPTHQKVGEVFRFIGQNPGLRLINPDDKLDMQRISDIDQSLPEEFADHAESDKKLIQEIREAHPTNLHNRDSEYIFGVAGLDGVPVTEVGELQGWVSFYRDEYWKELQEDGTIPRVKRDAMVLEVSYAKLPGAEKGQIASALRQACTQMSKIDAVRNANKPRTVSPQFIITSYVEPTNQASINVMEAAGFEKTSHVHTNNEGHKQNVWVLNWEKLNMLMHQRADNKLFSASLESIQK